MDQVIELLTRLLDAGRLSGSQITTALAEAGWTATGPTATTPHPRTRNKDSVDAWLPETPTLQIEFTLWERDVEEDWGDEGLDPVYDEATAATASSATTVPMTAPCRCTLRTSRSRRRIPAGTEARSAAGTLSNAAPRPGAPSPTDSVNA